MFRRPEPLAAHHRLDQFDCGRSELNLYLQKRALPSQKEGFARTYVIAGSDDAVVGYHAIASGMISRGQAPRSVGGHGAPSDIPVILLARLAVDLKHQGHGLGAELLKHAFHVSVAAASRIGVRAMLVHAIDEDAVRFYQRYGFRAAKGLERTLLCPIADIVAALDFARAQE
jgi:GNAT superfamily N-acetyltransferase